MVLFHKIFVSIIIIKKFIHILLFIYFVYIILKANILLSTLLAWHWISWLVWSNKPISSPYNTLICSANTVCCSCKEKRSNNKNARWSSCRYFFKHANSYQVSLSLTHNILGFPLPSISWDLSGYIKLMLFSWFKLGHICRGLFIWQIWSKLLVLFCPNYDSLLAMASFPWYSTGVRKRDCLFLLSAEYQGKEAYASRE